MKATKDAVPIPSDRITVGGYARDWIAGIKMSKRPKTYESYEATLRIHIVPSLGHKRLAQLTPSDLEALYAELIEKGYSPKSIRNYNACVHAMLEKAAPPSAPLANSSLLYGQEFQPV
ncbi:MAG: hypothetical protein IIB43_05750 [Candidatus Marinimicrobia bacterium]|nr:hypothetical protein [Candidatus Neomarinimicrobiota bacterium]